MSTHEGFWDVLCSHEAYFRLMFAVVAVMAVLNLAAMVLAEQSAGAFAISVLVFAVLGVTGLGLVVVLWQCGRR